MKVLVVTGGIGSGKSEVCRMLAANGFPLQYDADRRAKELYSERPALLDDIEKSLGISCRDKEGRFIPAALAERIFSDSSALAKVEELLFPVMMDDFMAFASRAEEDEYVVFESATILEKPYFDGFGDMILLVDAPLTVRMRRAAARDGVSTDRVMARMRNQKLMNALSDGASDPRVDHILWNDGSREDMEAGLKKILKHLNH